MPLPPPPAGSTATTMEDALAMHRMLVIAVLGSLSVGACDPDAPGAAAAQASAAGPAGSTTSLECRIAESGRTLSAETRETSGLARSRRAPDRFWTHNDSGNDPVLYPLSGEGAALGAVRVKGASLSDWEDIASASCSGGACLYIGDTGDNRAGRALVTVYEVAEPEPAATETATATARHARFPDQAQDAEALFALPDGALFIVTKGRHGPISLYRFPASATAGDTATLERVRQLAPQPRNQADRVTAASASPDGRWVALRTYRTLYLYPAAALVGGGPVVAATADLSPLGEMQGEALALEDDGSIRLTSEAEKRGLPAWSRLQCTLPDPAG
jgi:hypothetical protein